MSSPASAAGRGSGGRPRTRGRTTGRMHFAGFSPPWDGNGADAAPGPVSLPVTSETPIVACALRQSGRSYLFIENRCKLRSSVLSFRQRNMPRLYQNLRAHVT